MARASAAHTIALAQRLRALGGLKPLRRIGRVPKQLPPTAIERAYFAAISAVVVASARDALRHETPELMRLLAERRHHLGKTDASPGGGAIGSGRASQLGKAARQREERQQRERAGQVGAELGHASRQGKHAASLIERVARRFAAEFRPHALLEVVKKFGDRTNEHSKRELDKQVRAAMGVPLSALEKPVRDHIEEWAAINIDLIKSISDRYFDRLRLDVEHAFAYGTHPSTLAEQFEERYGMAEHDAQRIARDQINKLNGDVNKARQQALGVTRYFWRSMRDNRVRDAHYELAQRSTRGETFSYSDPPMGGGTNDHEAGNPGDGILCRCYAEPDFSALLAAA